LLGPGWWGKKGKSKRVYTQRHGNLGNAEKKAKGEVKTGRVQDRGISSQRPLIGGARVEGGKELV